jgi:hypothetical protein
VTKTGITVEEVKSHVLYGILLKAAGENAPLPDAAIQDKIRAAEDHIEHALRVFFGPRRVFSGVERRQNSTGVLKLPDDYDPAVDWNEPAYDYHNDFWGYDRWGAIKLRRYPVRRVFQVVFAYPQAEPVYRVPDPWIAIDRRYGLVRLVPGAQAAVYANFTGWFINAILGGRGLPQSIYVDYECGFTQQELADEHSDLLEAVRMRTFLLLAGTLSIVLTGGFSSESLSLDGLSRSTSAGGKYGPYSGIIEQLETREKELIATWESAHKGVPMVFI